MRVAPLPTQGVAESMLGARAPRAQDTQVMALRLVARAERAVAPAAVLGAPVALMPVVLEAWPAEA